MLQLLKHRSCAARIIKTASGRQLFTTFQVFDDKEKAEENRFIRELEKLEMGKGPPSRSQIELKEILGRELYAQCEFDVNCVSLG